MKNQINKLARGEFRYEMPKAIISSNSIEGEISLGFSFTGEFKITCDTQIKGTIYSTDYRVSVNNNSFIGTENIIIYTVDTFGVVVDDYIEGAFYIICEGGEYNLPYKFKVIQETIETSMGKINNLFHFSNLTQLHPEEAKTVFESDKFLDVFLKDNIEYQNIYRNLIGGVNVRNNMEEFLIAVNKKSTIEITIDVNSKKYDCFTENFKDILEIKKSTWGYVELEVEADAPFIQLSTNKIDSDQFTGNKYQIEYILDKKSMHYGKNFGRIVISSAYQKIEYEIEVDNYTIGIIDKRDYLTKGSHIEEQKAMAGIISQYIKFRTKVIDMKAWISTSNKLIDRIRGLNDTNPYFKLVQAQLFITAGKLDDAKWLLDNVKDDVCEDKEQNVILYCYYLYVNTLLKKDDEYLLEVYKIIKKYYDNGHDNWQLLWMLFYMDDEFDRNKSIKLARIKAQFHKGCTSPIIYLEACNIINSAPMLLRVFDSFELQVINFGCKYGIISDKTARQICEVGKSEKSVSKIYLKILDKVYNVYQNDEMLNVLCTHLIRNEMSGIRWFEVFEKSIIKGFRITRLYEFYMESIDKKESRQLPKMVLLYFAYNNQLPLEQKAYLYASIINSKDKDFDTYISYRKQMELFTIDQLRQGNISKDLMVVYNDFWSESIVNEETASTIAKLMFSYAIHVSDNRIVNVIVKHKESKQQQIEPIINGTAYVQIYTDDYSVVFEYDNRERRSKSVDYKMERILNDVSYAKLVYDYNIYDINLSLYFCEKNFKYNKKTVDAASLQNRLLISNVIEEEFKRELTQSIIEYYFYEYDEDDFRQRYSDIDNRNLTEYYAGHLIETCITHGLYDEAYELSVLYGYRKLSPKRLFKLSRRIVEITNYEYNEFLIMMCECAFFSKKYDDSILEYLVMNYNSTIENMRAVWEAARNFNVDTYELEERILAQIMFCDCKMNYISEIFEQYYQRSAKDRVVEAYLAYNSYKYFVKNQAISESVFNVIESRLSYNSDVIPVCKLAMLRFYSQQKHIDSTKLELLEKLLEEMSVLGKNFSFYSDFAGRLRMPYNIIDKTIIEYRTNPGNKVMISYSVCKKDKEGVYIKELLKDTYEGIFTKELTLFYGESCKYYITENINGEDIVSDIKTIIFSNINLDSTEGRFDYINDMLASKELHDMVTLTKLMHGYCVQEYVSNQLFELIK